VKYNAGHDYGALSGRNINEMLSCTRELDGQSDKHSAVDFALWKKASPEHIMRWPSPWSEGFPGWHMECSAMSLKYLGDRFDIHGGGMDLTFPHHEAEMAQGTAACGHAAAKYWMHNNMITIDGKKMGKSLGNFITLEQLFTGSHPLLAQAYSPMTIRFFMLQAHYRSTIDFSNDALQAAEKGLDRLMKAVETLDKLKPASVSSAPSTGASLSTCAPTPAPDPAELETRLREAMDDDLNSPLAVAALFDWVRVINSLHDGVLTISVEHLEQLRAIFHTWVFEILGLRNESAAAESNNLAPVMELILALRKEAKENKNWALSDKIRDGLAAAGIKVMDKKDGTSEWTLE
jgi:cysteinyl-tRNA synthetase